MSHDFSFFDQHTHATQRKRKRQQIRRNILIGACIFLFGYLFVMLYAVLEVYTNSETALRAIEQAKQEAIALHFEQSTYSLDLAQTSLNQAERPFALIKSAVFFPWTKKLIEEMGAILFAGKNVVGSLKSVSEIGTEVLQLSGITETYLTNVQEGISPRVSFSDLSLETKALVLQRLKAASGDIQLLSKRLELIHGELTRLSSQSLFRPFYKTFSTLTSQLDVTQASLERVSRFSLLIPAFAGIQDPSHHLILFLNNTELRPGGGFLGTYGIMTVLNGDVTSIKTSDVYALDRLAEQFVGDPAPFPLQKYNQTSKWFFRDANWSPDFSVSAEKILEKYFKEVGVLSSDQRSTILTSDSFEGVIAFTPTFVENLLRVIGPIMVRGQTFTAENVAETLEYQVEFGYAKQGIPENQRKEIVGDLVDAVITKLTTLQITEWSRVIDVFEFSLQSRQFFVYHTDAEIEKALTRVGWSGRYQPSTPDVQLVVDANLASLKTDSVVDRTIAYALFQNTRGEWIGNTTITYQHRGKFDWKTSRYRTYTRVYVPRGSKLLRSNGSLRDDRIKNPEMEIGVIDQAEELDMTVFGTFIAIEPGETRSLVFEYAVAPSVKEAIEKGSYALTLFKQNGARDHRLTLDLDFDTTLTRATPAEEKKEWGDDRYRLNTILDQDRKFIVGL